MRSITFSLLFSIWAFSSCKDACKDLRMADLLISNFAKTLVSGSTSSEVFTLAHTILNTAEGIACSDACMTVAEAGRNTFRRQFYYNANSPDNWGSALLTLDTLIDALPACLEASNIDSVEFLQDGYYKISAFVDALNNVAERLEDNNGYASFLRGEVDEMVIHVSGITAHNATCSPIRVLKSRLTYE